MILKQRATKETASSIPTTGELFDLSSEYDAMLNMGIRLSGENKDYFILGRVRDLRRRFPRSYKPLRILDFGCGIGTTAMALAESFPGAQIVGVDTAENALSYARETYGGANISFCNVEEIGDSGQFDLCYVNGVFHHIPPSERVNVARIIYGSLVSGGHFALFENNPWNFGAHMVMNRIPFDKDAQMLTPPEARTMLRVAGFTDHRTRSLFYLPRPLSILRFAEPWLAPLPLGAQYYILAVRP
jgi:SAM-dependent methyltransferase